MIFEPSHFSACRELNLSFVKAPTLRQQEQHKQVQAALEEALNRCQDRRHFLIDPAILTLGPGIEKAQFLKDIRESTKKTVLTKTAQAQLIQVCFDSSSGQFNSAKCDLIRKEERQHLNELIKKARPILSLAHPYELHTNRQQPFGEQAFQVPNLMIDDGLKKSAKLNGLEVKTPLTDKEKSEAQRILATHRPYQELVAQMKDSSYQQRPTSQKNMSFHHQLPERWKDLEQHFTFELHQLLTLAPSLKYLFSGYDPRKAETFSDEQINQAYRQLLQDFKSLQAEQRKPSSAQEDCLNLQSSVVNSVLTEKIKANQDKGKQFCQLAENLMAECEKDQQTREAAHILGLGGVCLFASPVVCGLVGAGDLGAEWAHEHQLSRRLQMEHSSGVRNWSEVNQQSKVEDAIKNGAPLALVGFPTSGFLASTRRVLRTEQGLKSREQVNQLFLSAQKGEETAIAEIQKAEQSVLQEKYGVNQLSAEEESSLYQLAKNQLLEKVESKVLGLPNEQRASVLKSVLKDTSAIKLEDLSAARRNTVMEALVEVRSSKLSRTQQDDKVSAIKKCLQPGGTGQL